MSALIVQWGSEFCCIPYGREEKEKKQWNHLDDKDRRGFSCEEGRSVGQSKSILTNCKLAKPLQEKERDQVDRPEFDVLLHLPFWCNLSSYCTTSSLHQSRSDTFFFCNPKRRKTKRKRQGNVQRFKVLSNTNSEELQRVSDICFTDWKGENKASEMIEQVPSLMLFFRITEKEMAKILEEYNDQQSNSQLNNLLCNWPRCHRQHHRWFDFSLVHRSSLSDWSYPMGHRQAPETRPVHQTTSKQRRSSLLGQHRGVWWRTADDTW